MDPETKCERRRCKHERKWHDPCSRCKCAEFVAAPAPPPVRVSPLREKRD